MNSTFDSQFAYSSFFLIWCVFSKLLSDLQVEWNFIKKLNKMGDYSSLGQQSQNFSQSSAFAAALQRAKQVHFRDNAV